MNRSEYLGVGFFIKPIPVIAVLTMAINDHYLKYHFSSWWTGKLSDFAGLFFLPLFLCAMWVMGANLLRGPGHWISGRSVFWTTAVTDLVFLAVKLVPAANHLYMGTLNVLGFPSALVMDPTDLVALSMNAATYWYARPYFQSHD